jgi:hypothetical protein
VARAEIDNPDNRSDHCFTADKPCRNAMQYRAAPTWF